MFKFLRSHLTFSTVAVSFHILITNIYEGTCFSTSFPYLWFLIIIAILGVESDISVVFIGIF